MSQVLTCRRKIYVCICVCIYVSVCVCVCVWIYVSVWVSLCMCICMSVFVNGLRTVAVARRSVSVQEHKWAKHFGRLFLPTVYVYVCMCVFVCIYMSAIVYMTVCAGELTNFNNTFQSSRSECVKPLKGQTSDSLDNQSRRKSTTTTTTTKRSYLLYIIYSKICLFMS